MSMSNQITRWARLIEILFVATGSLSLSANIKLDFYSILLKTVCLWEKIIIR